MFPSGWYRRAQAQVLVPAGTRVAFTGGSECNEDRIWAALDKVRAKHADMVLLHGGSPKGAELIAAKWADTRKVPQVVFKPDWAKHKNAAPFKRNDALLEAMPVLVFRGNGRHRRHAVLGAARLGPGPNEKGRRLALARQAAC